MGIHSLTATLYDYYIYTCKYLRHFGNGKVSTNSVFNYEAKFFKPFFRLAVNCVRCLRLTSTRRERRRKELYTYEYLYYFFTHNQHHHIYGSILYRVFRLEFTVEQRQIEQRKLHSVQV